MCVRKKKKSETQVKDKDKDGEKLTKKSPKDTNKEEDDTPNKNSSTPEDDEKPKEEGSKDKSNESKKMPARERQFESFKVTRATPKAKAVVVDWVTRTLNMGVQNLIVEFRELAKWCPVGMTQISFNENKEKNRYLDVPCQDSRRVVLKWPTLESDYIHANYVATPNSDHRFICTQGPLENTQFAFWVMVVQEEVECIIMLCNIIECSKFKCMQYWPREKDTRVSFGEGDAAISIFCKETRQMSAEDPFVRICSLMVNWTENGEKKERNITHYQWENWPDRGVPPTKFTAVNLLSSVRGSEKPILVHCSAGIGRTGTIVAVAYVQEKMQAGVDCMAMNELLKELRTQRPYSIQNELQYLYLHRVLLAYFLERYAARHAACLKGDNEGKYKKWIEDYNTATSTG